MLLYSLEIGKRPNLRGNHDHDDDHGDGDYDGSGTSNQDQDDHVDQYDQWSFIMRMLISKISMINMIMINNPIIKVQR